jgi:hypothetical protein
MPEWVFEEEIRELFEESGFPVCNPSRAAFAEQYTDYVRGRVHMMFDELNLNDCRPCVVLSSPEVALAACRDLEGAALNNRRVQMRNFDRKLTRLPVDFWPSTGVGMLITVRLQSVASYDTHARVRR